MSLHIYDKKLSIGGRVVHILAKLISSERYFKTRNNTKRFISKTNNEKTYRIPKPKKLKSNIYNEYFENMQVFTLNDQQRSDQKVIFYNHGSGWLVQPVMMHWLFLDKLALALDAKIIVPIYPKIPKNNYLDAYNKLISLYKEVSRSVNDINQITLMGDSAGGNISLGMAHELHAQGIATPEHVVLLSACVDMSFDNPLIPLHDMKDDMLAAEGLRYIAEIWKGNTSISDPIISPINGTFADNINISHFVGTNEVFYPDALALDKKLTTENISIDTYVYPEMVHAFAVMAIKEGRSALNRIINILS